MFVDRFGFVPGRTGLGGVIIVALVETVVIAVVVRSRVAASDRRWKRSGRREKGLEGFLRHWGSHLLLIQIGGSGQFGDQPLDLRMHRTVQGVLDDEVNLIVVIGEQTNVTIDDLG